MDKVSSGGQLWPLKSSSGENPTVTQGGSAQFEFNDVPDRAPTGPLAYYLNAVILTVVATITQGAEGTNPIPRDRLVGALIDSFNWTNSFFGAPLSKDFVKGSFFPLVEFFSGGYRYGQRQFNPIPATAGAYEVFMRVAIPACNLSAGRLGRDTSQLALLYQPSHLKVNMAPASVLTGLSAGATIADISLRASAVLIPRQEIVLATPMEWVLHEIAVGGPSVKITGFGRDTALTGVEDKGGVAFLGELTQVYAEAAALSNPESIDSMTFQWRGQGELQDIGSWVDMLMGGLPNDRPQLQFGVVAGDNATNDYQGYPYPQQNSDGFNSVDPDLKALAFFPLVQAGHMASLAELETAERDETYYLNPASVFSGGDNHEILACYAREWQQKKRDAFVAYVKQGGPNSLAAAVLLEKAAGSALQQRYPRDKHTLSPDQHTYLPWQLI